MNKVKFGNWIVFLGFIFLISYILIQFYWYHDSVTTGSKYGYSIGSTKKQVYEIAKNNYGKDQVSGIYIHDLENYIYIKGADVLFSKATFKAMNTSDFWVIDFFSYTNIDNISFTFEDDKLIEIYRQIQYSEVP